MSDKKEPIDLNQRPKEGLRIESIDFTKVSSDILDKMRDDYPAVVKMHEEYNDVLEMEWLGQAKGETLDGKTYVNRNRKWEFPVFINKNGEVFVVAYIFSPYSFKKIGNIDIKKNKIVSQVSANDCFICFKFDGEDKIIGTIECDKVKEGAKE